MQTPSPKWSPFETPNLVARANWSGFDITNPKRSSWCKFQGQKEWVRNPKP